MPLAPSYDPKDFETRLYAEWERSGVFAPRGGGPAYSILLPPPNVTGTLHMGHAFQHTLQDALIRYHRMRGDRTLWQMGTDHAGIATEMVVARNLALAGSTDTRDSLGREGFIEKVWEWKAQSGDTIERQMRRLGTSGDWSRGMFTMDPIASEAVVEAFVRLHGQGLIYRGQKLVNWDPGLNTAISDLEVENREVPGHMWHFKYPLADGATYEYVEHDADGQVVLRETRDYIAIATTRPETMLGDGAVAVHPSDARYAPIVGKLCEIPVGPKALRRLIPIIVDTYPDPEFGSGAVKITGAHDFNDYAVAARNGLPLYALLDGAGAMRRDGLSYEDSARIAGQIARGERGAEDVGALNLVPEDLRGLDRFDARKRVVAAITGEGLAVTDGDGTPRVEAKTIMQPFGDRSGVVIEPMLTDQWFVRMDGFAKRGLELVEGRNGQPGRIRFVPPNWINTYRHWLENIQDWCISRQLWWGHRIPAWYDDAGNVHVGRDEADARARAGLGSDVALRQDDDVLETWFSSGIWPISTMGWPDDAAMAERGFADFVPSSVLVTGFDIIFFWVARMIMLTDALAGEIPFRDVYITGLVRDKDGQKMSKSKGNILDPLDLIDGIALDALVAKRTTGLMKPTDAPKIEKATRKEFPDGIPAFGADALRFTMAALAGPGRDIKFDLARCEGYKNFCNKLWNATRYALHHFQPEIELDENAPLGYQSRPNLALEKPAQWPVTQEERWLLSRLSKVSKDAKDHFSSYRFDLLAQSLYEFSWNEFCDWFIELSKPHLNLQVSVDVDGDGGLTTDLDAMRSLQYTLFYSLERLLSLLHPLIPFVTEELWQAVAPRLGIDETTIALRPYPMSLDFTEDARAVADIEWLKSMVSALRRIRSELSVSPGRTIKLALQGGDDIDRSRLQHFSRQLTFLARLDPDISVGWLDPDDEPPPAAAALVGNLKLFVPLEGLVDLDAERTRLDKEIARIAGEIEKSEAKLAKFSDKVPASVIEQERQRLADWRIKFDTLSAQRARL